MRILVDLPEKTLQKLNDISTLRRVPRAAIVREALDAFVKQESEAATQHAFGLWKSGPDGLMYQREMRGEW